MLAKPTTKRYQTYQKELIDDLLGTPHFDSNSHWFAHGVEWEGEARKLYEWETDTNVDEIGLIVHPRLQFVSASPDGLIGLHGGIEIKCRKSLNAHTKSIEKGVESNYRHQILANLWITEREWWDYVSFYKNPDTGFTHLYRQRFYRDKAQEQKYFEACCVFYAEILEVVNKCQLDTTL